MNEPQTPTPLDREAFQRVWRRVMPEDRLDCPFTLEEPAAAPEPSSPPQPASLSAPAPVPPPPVVHTLPQTGAPLLPICLGEQSAGDLPALEAMLCLTADSFRIYRTLARRKGNQGRSRERREGLFSALADAKQFQIQRLSAAHFLISGREHTLLPTDPPAFPSLPLALRARFQAEQQAAVQLMAAANAAGDPCLMELYRTLAMENQGHARQLRDQLVKLQG